MAEDMTQHVNREDWLEAAIAELAPVFAAAGHTIPRVHVSVGLSTSTTKAGQCHARAQSADGRNHVFIAAFLAQESDVLQTLTHELVHAVIDCRGGHRGRFQQVAASVGLAGPPWTATRWTDAGLACARSILERIGPYPHARLEPKGKRQTNRMFKCVCTCGYTARLARVWLSSHGSPLCPACARPLAPPTDIEAKPLDARAFVLEIMRSLEGQDLFDTLTDTFNDAIGRGMSEVVDELVEFFDSRDDDYEEEAVAQPLP